MYPMLRLRSLNGFSGRFDAIQIMRSVGTKRHPKRKWNKIGQWRIKEGHFMRLEKFKDKNKQKTEWLLYLKVLLGDRIESIESISSSNERTIGSSIRKPLCIRHGPVTLTSWAQSPTVDEVIKAVAMDVLVTVDTIGSFFFLWLHRTGKWINLRSSSSNNSLSISVDAGQMV